MAFLGAVEANDLKGRTFNAIVAACGYETRARYLPELFTEQATKRLACRFSHQRCFAYQDNEEFYKAAQYSFVDATDAAFTDALRDSLSSALTSTEQAHFFVDISSQSRARLAGIITAVEALAAGRKILVTFGYSIARYTTPFELEAPNVEIGPISPRFAGWTSDPERALELIVGLGYEQDRALGAFEFLEPARAWALMPTSQLTGYRRALRKANALLLQSIDPNRVLEYDVSDANATFAKLRSLAIHLSRSSNVVFLPCGPKILALLALLVATEREEIAVWRVSAGVQETPTDRKPSGHCVFVQHEFLT